MASQNKFITIVGAKGGVGASFLLSNLGMLLAEKGKQVVVADAWPRSSHLHHYLGMPASGEPIKQFIEGDGESTLEGFLWEHAHSPLKLFSGRSATPFFNISPQKRRQLLRSFKKQPTDFFIVDVPADFSEAATDTFLASSFGVLVVDPMPPSLESAFDFLKGAVFKLISKPFRKNTEVLTFIADAMDPEAGLNMETVEKILSALETLDAPNTSKARKYLSGFKPKIILNSMESPEDEEVLPPFARLCEKYLNVSVNSIGSISRSSEVASCILKGLPFVVGCPQSPMVAELESIAQQVIAQQSEKS